MMTGTLVLHLGGYLSMCSLFQIYQLDHHKDYIKPTSYCLIIIFWKEIMNDYIKASGHYRALSPTRHT